MKKSLNNWFISLKLECKSMVSYTSILSFYFIGFGCGILIFFLPDSFGRRGTMKIIMPIYAMFASTSLYAYDLHIKKIGFFG